MGALHIRMPNKGSMASENVQMSKYRYTYSIPKAKGSRIAIVIQNAFLVGLSSLLRKKKPIMTMGSQK